MTSPFPGPARESMLAAPPAPNERLIDHAWCVGRHVQDDSALTDATRISFPGRRVPANCSHPAQAVSRVPPSAHQARTVRLPTSGTTQAIYSPCPSASSTLVPRTAGGLRPDRGGRACAPSALPHPAMQACSRGVNSPATKACRANRLQKDGSGEAVRAGHSSGS